MGTIIKSFGPAIDWIDRDGCYVREEDGMPAWIVRPDNVGCTSVYFAIRLQTMRILPQEEWRSYKEFVVRQVDRQMDFIRSVSELHEQFAVDLRYLFNPRSPHDVSVAFIFRLPCPGDMDHATVVNSFSKVILNLLMVNNNLHEFQLVLGQEDLEYLISPFEVRHIVEISRREAVIELDRLSGARPTPLGFLAEPVVASDPKTYSSAASVYYVFPFVVQQENRERLCNVLMLQTNPCMVSVCLSKYLLSAADIAGMEQRVSICEKYAHVASYAVNEPLDQLVPLLTGQADVLKRNCTHEYFQLRDTAFLVKIQVASTEDIPHDLIATVAASISEHAGHPEITDPFVAMFSGGYSIIHSETEDTFLTARDNLLHLGFSPWLPTLATGDACHWRSIFGVSQASAAFRLPFPVSSKFPGVETVLFQEKPSPSTLPEEGVRLGTNRVFNQERPVYFSTPDRCRHAYVVGQTGTGKSTLFANMILQDIRNGHGVAVLDPHGELIEEIITNIPESRLDDVVYIDAQDYDFPIGINMLEHLACSQEKDFCVNYLMEVFDQLYDLRQTGGPMFEMYMRNALQLLMDQPLSFSATIMDAPRVFQDRFFRKKLLRTCTNPFVVNFWRKEAEKAGGESSLENMTPYITSKLTRFVYNDLLRVIIGQKRTTINFRELMDTGKILLVDLRKGILGETNSRFLGMLLVGKIFSATLSRTDTGDKESLRDFFLYVDEFQNLATPTFVSILSEARKYRLSLTITNQYVFQIPEIVRAGIFGNIGTLISFRVGSQDAELLSKEFSNIVTPNDLMGLPNFHTYIRLLVDGSVTSPFNMKTMSLERNAGLENTERIRRQSRERYGRDRTLVEQEIRENFLGSDDDNIVGGGDS